MIISGTAHIVELERRAKRANLDSLLLRVCDVEKELERVIVGDPSTCDVQGRTTREGGE